MEKTVLFEIKNNIGIITLNSPKTLNSLSLDMINSMLDSLKSWENNHDVKSVLLQGNGEKAFCAGGDVVALYKAMAENNEKDAFNFFTAEYQLDQYIHEYKKPIICLANKIVMGGGIGIMNGAGFRVVTENTKLAMPEITIGLFPDVGGSYFLNKMPKGLGLFLALTGARFNGPDALYLKMADYFVTEEDLEPLKEELFRCAWSLDNQENYNVINRILTAFDGKSKSLRPPSEIERLHKEIENLTNFSNVLELSNFWKDYKTEEPFIQRALKTFFSGSPTSAAVIFEQIKKGADLSISEVFKRELGMAKQFVKHHDFKEGVRALLIEKDNNPKWNPTTLEKITSDLVIEHFS